MIWISLYKENMFEMTLPWKYITNGSTIKMYENLFGFLSFGFMAYLPL